MTQAAFTPGPWDYERTVDAADLPRPWVGRLSESRFAALACGITDEEVAANARLIAAAPDLYADLKVIIQAFAPKDHPLTKRCLGTLAKACGEQEQAA